MKITLIGYGEVGRILTEELRVQGHAVTAYDLELHLDSGEAMREHARLHGVELANSHAHAVRNAELVVSAVTADQTVEVARACTPALLAGSFFLDLNSASPGAKIRAAEQVARSGAYYVEAAVMTSVPPHRIRVPLLIGGPHAAALEPRLRDLGFVAKLASETLGVASATKMCRSVMIKGLEAMVIESFTAARHYGVEDTLIASLEESFPGIDWEEQAAYFFQRVIEHGRRRSEEMREAAVTVREAGIDPWISSSAAERQAWVANLAERGLFGRRPDSGFDRSPDWRIEADHMLSALRTGEQE